MKRPATAIMISACIISISLSLAGIAQPQEQSATHPWITRYGSWSLADERGRPANRLSGSFGQPSYVLSLTNSDAKKNYRFNLSCISGVFRIEVDISSLQVTSEKAGSVSVDNIKIDVASGKTTLNDMETLNATVHNGFFEGEVNQPMLEYLKKQNSIDLSIVYKGFKEREEIPASMTLEAISAFMS